MRHDPLFLCYQRKIKREYPVLDVLTLTSATPRKFFEETLPRKFDPHKATGLDAVIQINITGPDGGFWTVRVKQEKMDIREGVDSSPNLSVKISDSDFLDLVNGKLNAVGAFMAGKIEFKGSTSLGLKLVELGIL
jgi:putative sterol carrier protein